MRASLTQTSPLVHRARAFTIAFVITLAVFGVLALLRIMKGRTDDFQYVFEAATAVTLRQNIYHFGQGINPYPPLTAAWVSLLVPLGERGAAAVWLPFNVLGLGLAIWLGAKEVVCRLDIQTRDPSFLPCVALCSLLLVIEPAMGTIRRGNKDVFLLLPIVLALRWIDTRAILAGALLAVGASVKYLTIVFVPYFLVRGRFKAALGFLLGWLACALLPALTLGWAFNLEMQKMAYGGVARMLGVKIDDAGIANAAPPDLEVTGASALQAMRRLATGLEWGSAGTYALTTLAAGLCVLVVWRLYAARGQNLFVGRFGESERAASHTQPARRSLVLLEWCGITVAMLAFSLHLETRHTVLLAPVYACAAAMLLRPGAPGSAPRWPLLVATLASFAAYRLPPGDLAPQLMQQWRFVGGSSWILLIFLMVLLWTGLRYRPLPDAAAHRPASTG